MRAPGLIQPATLYFPRYNSPSTLRVLSYPRPTPLPRIAVHRDDAVFLILPIPTALPRYRLDLFTPGTAEIKRIHTLKKSLLALSLGLAASLIGTSAFATTGTIKFEGKITATTCPIEVVNPEDGSVGNTVKMGSLEASRFTASGVELPGKSFDLRVTGGAGCGITPTSKANVTFNGMADPTGSYFAVTPTADGAKGVVIVLKDNTGSPVAPGGVSADYDLADTGPTDMRFNAYYRSTAATVTAGVASADVQFIVAIN